MTDNTQADEYLQEQLVEQGDVSSMRYIGDDYTRIVTIREDRLLKIITAYTNKQVAIAQERAYHASIQSIEMLMRNEHEQRNKLKENKNE